MVDVVGPSQGTDDHNHPSAINGQAHDTRSIDKRIQEVHVETFQASFCRCSVTDSRSARFVVQRIYAQTGTTFAVPSLRQYG
jgi:hypothetical protein